MKLQIKFLAVLLIIIILLTSVSLIILKYNPTPNFIEPLPDNYVTKIIDGDTFETASGEIIRLLCVDTPEKGEEGYQEATAFLESLILDREVVLEEDVQDKDAYGRSLRYVYVDDVFVNEQMYLGGYAEMLVIPPSDSRCGEIENLEIENW